MLLNEEFEKDEVQLKKAKIKVVAVTSLIPELIRLNDELSMEDRKPYTVSLDYINHDDFKNFIIDIRRSDKRDSKPMLRVHFGLRSIEEGLKLFDEVRDCFMESSDVLYTSFSVEHKGQLANSYNILGVNRIDLKYHIHNRLEYEKLEKYNNSLYEEKAKVKVLV